MPSKKADPFHWDALVRLTHWGVAAICIGNLWLNGAGEEWHASGWDTPSWCSSAYACCGAHLRSRPRPPACPPSSRAGRIFAIRPTPCANGPRPPRAITAAARAGGLGHSGCWYSPPQGPAGSRTPRPASIRGADDWHEWCTWAPGGMIALHLCAIAYHLLAPAQQPGHPCCQGVVPGPVPGSRNPTSERSRAGPLFIPSLPLDGISHRSAPSAPPAATEWHESIFHSHFLLIQPCSIFQPRRFHECYGAERGCLFVRSTTRQ